MCVLLFCAIVRHVCGSGGPTVAKDQWWADPAESGARHSLVIEFGTKETFSLVCVIADNAL